MALEDLTGTNKFISNLVASNPTPTDGVVQGDDHIRGIKQVLLNSFPALVGPSLVGLPGQPIATQLIPNISLQRITAVGSTQFYSAAPFSYIPKKVNSTILILAAGGWDCTCTAGGFMQATAGLYNLAGPGLGQLATLGRSDFPVSSILYGTFAAIGVYTALSLAQLDVHLGGNINAAGSTGMSGAAAVFMEFAP